MADKLELCRCYFYGKETEYPGLRLGVNRKGRVAVKLPWLFP